MANKDKGNQKMSVNDTNARKPKSNKLAKQQRREKKAAKAAKKL